MTQSAQTTIPSYRTKAKTRSKIKWRTIYLNLPVNVIVRIPHPWSRESQGWETFLTTSPDKKTHNFDTECLNHHLSL